MPDLIGHLMNEIPGQKPEMTFVCGDEKCLADYKSKVTRHNNLSQKCL